MGGAATRVVPPPNVVAHGFAKRNDYETLLGFRIHPEFSDSAAQGTTALPGPAAGSLIIQFRDRDVVLGPGQLYVVPRGVEHCPKAEGEVRAILIEPTGVVNTGEAGGALTAQYDDSLLG